MRHGFLVLLIFILLLSCLPIVRLSQIGVEASDGYPVHNLNTGLNYTAIQEAVDAPETLNGHTIFVDQGVYYEHVMVDKSLSLVGENRNTTVIDGNFTGNPVTITASHVNVTGFTIQRAWFGILYVFNGFGVYVSEGTSYVNIAHNIITNNKMWGIMVNGSSHDIVSDNIFLNNYGSGVAIRNSSDNAVFSNYVQNCSLGILVIFSTANAVHDNIVLKNTLGMELALSSNNQLADNNMAGNRFNFIYYGLSDSDFNNSIAWSNLVDGKHILVLQNAKNAVVDLESDIGTAYLIRSENITVRDVFLANNGVGLFLWNTKNARIENVTVSQTGAAIDLIACSSITIRNCSITDNVGDGIYANTSSLCDFTENTIARNNGTGIGLEYSSEILISANRITNNFDAGILIAYDGNNSVSENLLVENRQNVRLFSAYNDTFVHNNFIKTGLYAGYDQVFLYDPSSAIFDNGFEGNYWNTYNGTDTNGDGIGDTPYVLNENNIDNYPLMGMFSSFNVSLGGKVNIISNSTVEDLKYFQANGTIRVNISNITADQIAGFCRVAIPHGLMNVSSISIVIDGGSTPILYPNYTVYDNGSSRWIYFAYENSPHEIVIIPELNPIFALPLLMLAVSAATVLSRRRRMRTEK